jgi:hypothetical protein
MVTVTGTLVTRGVGVSWSSTWQTEKVQGHKKTHFI